MKFRTALNIDKSSINISTTDHLIFMGSCFSEHMAENCKTHYLPVFSNPFGVIFHPLALFNILLRALKKEWVEEKELVLNQGKHHFLGVHSSFSDAKANIVLEKVNQALLQTHQELVKAKYLFLTMGTAYGYIWKENGQTVANCHKIPFGKFEKKLSSQSMIIDGFNLFYETLLKLNPTISIVFTVSPVRHLKDGFIENTRSKARLIELSHQWGEDYKNVHYFPSYELLIDDLRDYRFYKDDLLHPNSQAIQYIWEVFTTHYFNEEGRSFLKEAARIQKLKAHKVLDPASRESKDFLQKKEKQIRTFIEKYNLTDL